MNEIKIKVIFEIDKALETMGKIATDFNFAPCIINISEKEKSTRELEAERQLLVSEEDLQSIHRLNKGQKKAYDEIISKCLSNFGGAFFINGLEGTRKTYLFKALQPSTLRVI